jgi:NAD(P)-dependent dehydrogenase (short-subunit alcohol dehydrogenase family)
MATAVITGCSKGIGLATALAFARAGYSVHATMRNPEAAPELGQIAARENLPIHISRMDVVSDESVATAVAAIQKRGPIDVLVNNAGVERSGSIEELPISAFREEMETNYFGVLRCSKAVVKGMRERGGGCIVNVSSVAGTMSNPPLTGYCASKWALEALSEGLAAEMRTFGVRVLLVKPGIIDTPMARHFAEKSHASIYRQGQRLGDFFVQSLTNPVAPDVVAAKILDVVQSGTWTFRHLVGPDAEPLLAWRKTLTDEEWIDLYASDDATFGERLQRAFAPE